MWLRIHAIIRVLFTFQDIFPFWRDARMQTIDDLQRLLDSSVGSRSKTEDVAIMQRDERASRRFRAKLWSLGVTTDHTNIEWARQHPREVIQWTGGPLDDALAMCGVFSTIRGAGHTDGYVLEQSSGFFRQSTSSKVEYDIRRRIAFLHREMHALNHVYERCAQFLA